jgi:hypothetical protein
VGVNRNEFDHLPGPAKDVWRELARRASVSGRYYRRRCRQLSFELDIAERRMKALDRENALLTAQVDVLRMALEAPRGVVPRPREDD